MSARFFVDTNLLVYAIDEFDLAKQEKARKLLKAGGERHSLVLSTQILQEFYVTATRKLEVEPLTAKLMVHTYSAFETILVTKNILLHAIDCSAAFKISFWDALVIVAAELANCKAVLSEDLNDGQVIRGVKVVNPFRNFDEVWSQLH